MALSLTDAVRAGSSLGFTGLMLWPLVVLTQVDPHWWILIVFFPRMVFSVDGLITDC